MFAHLIKKSDKYICSNCKMQQKEIKETCSFCNYFFSNYEVIKLEKIQKS